MNAAVALKPDIISCSWGFDLRESDGKPSTSFPAGLRPLAAAVANAVSQGIIVVFSAGNGHYGFPGIHPDVISAGGVYMQADGSLEATQYASGFKSSIYAGRNVPDVCGLVGLPPKAIYIKLRQLNQTARLTEVLQVTSTLMEMKQQRMTVGQLLVVLLQLRLSWLEYVL